jgi:hypothetical protein
LTKFYNANLIKEYSSVIAFTDYGKQLVSLLEYKKRKTNTESQNVKKQKLEMTLDESTKSTEIFGIHNYDQMTDDGEIYCFNTENNAPLLYRGKIQFVNQTFVMELTRLKREVKFDGLYAVDSKVVYLDEKGKAFLKITTEKMTLISGYSFLLNE